MNNQLQKFRQQLARQHPRLVERKIRVRPTKPDFKLNHGPLMQSLTQAAQHIDNFYKTPVDALSQAAQLCSLRKQLATTALLQQLEAQPEPEAEADTEQQNWMQVKSTEVQAELREEVDMLEYRKFVKQVQLDESRDQLLKRCRTPSPLLTTEEMFRPMRAAAERQRQHLQEVRAEEDQREQQQPREQTLQREASTCSNTSEGIDSVISDLAEEALYELQMEAAEQDQQQLDEQLQQVEVEVVETTVDTTIKLVKFHLPTPESTPSPTTSSVEQLQPLLIRRIEIPKVVLQPKHEAEQSEEKQPLDSCSDAATVEKERIIGELFHPRSEMELDCLRKYFLKWIHYTTMEKIEREPGKTHVNRAAKINAFLDKLRQEKRRQRNNRRATTPTDSDKLAQRSVEQRQEAIRMTKQFKTK